MNILLKGAYAVAVTAMLSAGLYAEGIELPGLGSARPPSGGSGYSSETLSYLIQRYDIEITSSALDARKLTYVTLNEGDILEFSTTYRIADSVTSSYSSGRWRYKDAVKASGLKVDNGWFSKSFNSTGLYVTDSVADPEGGSARYDKLDLFGVAMNSDYFIDLNVSFYAPDTTFDPFNRPHIDDLATRFDEQAMFAEGTIRAHKLVYVGDNGVYPEDNLSFKINGLKNAPVPEPGMLGMGLIGLGLIGLRRSR